MAHRKKQDDNDYVPPDVGDDEDLDLLDDEVQRPKNDVDDLWDNPDDDLDEDDEDLPYGEDGDQYTYED